MTAISTMTDMKKGKSGRRAGRWSSKTWKNKKTGTKVNFLPGWNDFEKTRFKAEDVKSRMHETAYLNPELTIVFEDLRDGKKRRSPTTNRKESSDLSRI